jgi:DNA-binding MarR family transcriptional regulator
MTDEQYRIIDEASPRTNFTMVPNIVDDMMLSPHAFRLYIHFRRVAGENRLCYQSVKTLAMICKMSTGMVSQAKKELVEAGLIREFGNVYQVMEVV